MIEFIILFIIIIYIILINIDGYYLLDYFNSILKLENNDPIIYTRSRGLINLKHNYDIIKEEYLQYQKNHKIPIFGEITKDQDYLSNDQIDSKWRVVVLRMYNKDTNLCKYFPNTMKLLDLIPNISLIMFSILEPHKKITPHRGVYHGVLRYHLGLITPSNYEDCFIVIDKNKYTWMDGDDIIFDDTYTHYVYNNTDESRVILFLDIKKEYKNMILNMLNDLLLLVFSYNITTKDIVEKVELYDTDTFGNNNSSN